MHPLCAASLAVANDLHSLLNALEDSGDRAAARRQLRAAHLGDRARALVVDLRAAPDALQAPLADPIRAVSLVVDELAPARDPLPLRGRAIAAYQELAAGLRALRVRAPSLRPRNYARSVFHLACGLVALACIELLPGRAAMLVISGGFLAFAWGLEVARRRSDLWRRFSLALFHRVIHPHEIDRVNSATWYVTALFCLALWAPIPCCAMGVTVLAFADPAAALVGRRYGRLRIRSGRSVEGTATFLGVAALVAFGVLRGFHPGLAVGATAMLAAGAASAGSLAELYSGPVDDNFTIPVVVAAATWPLFTFLS